MLDRGGSCEDQLAGLAGFAEHLPIDALIVSAPPGGRAHSAILEEVSTAGGPVTPVAPGQRVDLGGVHKSRCSPVGRPVPPLG